MKKVSLFLTMLLVCTGISAQTAQSVLDKTITKLEFDFGIETKVQIKNTTQFDILPANASGIYILPLIQPVTRPTIR